MGHKSSPIPETMADKMASKLQIYADKSET
jgi:hypothetical protein